MLLEVVVSAFTVLLGYGIVYYARHLRTLKRYPSGPFPLPWIGNTNLLVFSTIHECFDKLSKKYGDVFSISLFMDRTVIVTSIHAAREALKNSDLQGRYTNRYEIALMSRDYRGIIAADFTPEYIFNRNLAHKALKAYDYGNAIEEKIKLARMTMIDRLTSFKGELVDVRLMAENTVLNVICRILFGDGYHLSESDFHAVEKFNRYLTNFKLRPDPAGYMKWTRLFYESVNIRSVKEGVVLRDNFIGNKLKEHEDTYKPGIVRDFCDSLIKSVREDENHWKEIGSKDMIRDSLEMILSDMVIAGTETVAASLSWAVLYFLRWPHLQDQLYQEIIEVMGTEDYPCLTDRPRLPLCQAYIQEILRMSSPLHLVSRKAVKDGKIGGIAVPSGTQIIFDVWAINRDPREWKDPETFDPHRWIDEEGNCVSGHSKSYIPFGGGRRICLGGQMGKHELFLFVTSLIKSFKIEESTKESLPSLIKGTDGLVLSPHSFRASFIPRESIKSGLNREP